MNSCASMAFCHVSSGMSTWIVARNLWCKRGGTFKNLRQAQAACLTLGSNCHGVYDDGCDGHGELHVCKTSSVLNPSGRSCVYMPTTFSSTVFKPSTSATLKSAVRTYVQDSPACKLIGDFLRGLTSLSLELIVVFSNTNLHTHTHTNTHTCGNTSLDALPRCHRE